MDPSKDWRLERPIQSPNATFHMDHGQPEDASHRRAWLKAYFAYLSPHFTEKVFDEFLAHAVKGACRSHHESGSILTDARLDVQADEILWGLFFMRFRRVSKPPQWPWGTYWPKETPEEVGVSPRFQSWVDAVEARKKAQQEPEQKEVEQGLVQSLGGMSLSQTTPAPPSANPPGPAERPAEPPAKRLTGIETSRWNPDKVAKPVVKDAKAVGGGAADGAPAQSATANPPAVPSFGSAPYISPARPARDQASTKPIQAPAAAPVAATTPAALSAPEVRSDKAIVRLFSEVDYWKVVLANSGIEPTVAKDKLSVPFELALPLCLNCREFVGPGVMERFAVLVDKHLSVEVTDSPAGPSSVRVRLSDDLAWLNDTRPARQALRKQWQGIVAWVVEARHQRPVALDEWCRSAPYHRAANAQGEETKRLYADLVQFL